MDKGRWTYTRKAATEDNNRACVWPNLEHDRYFGLYIASVPLSNPTPQPNLNLCKQHIWYSCTESCVQMKIQGYIYMYSCHRIRSDGNVTLMWMDIFVPESYPSATASSVGGASTTTTGLVAAIALSRTFCILFPPITSASSVRISVGRASDV